MGVVLDGGAYVITCAHVINIAIDRDDGAKAQPDGSITISFILCEREFTRQGRVVKWFPPDAENNPEDLALLKLDREVNIALDDAVFAIPRINELVRAYGILSGSSLGVWWQGWMSFPVRRKRFQLEQNDAASAKLERGFSGSPLLSNNGERIYGIVSRVRKNVGYMIPSQELDLVHKVLSFDLDEATENPTCEPCSPRGDGGTAILASTTTEQQDALIEIEVNADYGKFSDEDASYFKKVIEYLAGQPNARLTISYIRRGSAIIGFNVASENSEDAKAIVAAINRGALEDHGVMRAQLAEYAAIQEEMRSIQPTAYFKFKPATGRLLSLILLIPSLTVLAFLVLLIRITSRGPAIYRQVRVGKDGQVFTMYKLRTMRVDAEAVTGVVWASQNDPRVTPLGRFLRKTHLDELPQLFNVLTGEMAIIGPRPERPEFARALEKVIPGYADRLAVRPGITGLHSVNFPPDSDVESVRRKTLVDRYYIEHASLTLDLMIFADVCLRALGIPLRLTARIAIRAL